MTSSTLNFLKRLLCFIFIIFLQLFLNFVNQDKAFAYKINDLDLGFGSSIKEIYDDNITFTKDNRKKDFSTVFGLGFTAGYETKRQKLNAAGNIYHQIFNKYRKYNNTSQDFTFDYLNELTKRNRLSVTNDFLHSYEPRSFEQEFAGAGGRYAYYHNDFNLVFSRDINSWLLGQIKYTNGLDDFSRSDLSDSYLNKWGFSIECTLDKLTSLLASYEIPYRNFSPGEAALKQVVSGGLRREINDTLFVEFQVGADMIHDFDDSNYTKPHYLFLLNQDIDKKTVGRVYFIKEYATTAYVQNIFDSWQVACDLTREISKKLDGTVAIFYGAGKYLPSEIKDSFRGGRVRLTYKLNRIVKMNLNYDYSRLDSNTPGREYARNSGTLGVDIEF